MVQLNMNNNNKKITEQDHDHVKGSKLPIQTRCVQFNFCQYDAMLEEKNIIKAFQIHPFLACNEE